MRDVELLPIAPDLIESTRAIGYSFDTAIADIIDNSISAKAKKISIDINAYDDPYVAILDDGCGMDLEELKNAMRYGSTNPNADRNPNDLGRFGLGLKTASLSQCRKLTVVSKKDGVINACSWDLDYVIKTRAWKLIVFDKEEIGNDFPFIKSLLEQRSGTIVIWKNFDFLKESSITLEDSLNEKTNDIIYHLSLVFHRYLNNEDIKNRISIIVNNQKLTPLDPFLTTHTGTQVLPEEPLEILGQKILVKPYILPHFSKLSQEDKYMVGGEEGFKKNQGFYIYRNRRLIQWGTWFKMSRQEELYKLARVIVDTPNTLDSIWKIDVKKSSAELPNVIKVNLCNIIKNIVDKSEKVFTYRGRSVSSKSIMSIWKKVDNRGTFSYQINREHPLVKFYEESLNRDEHKKFEKFINLIQDSFPYDAVYVDVSKGNIKKEEYDIKEIKQNMREYIEAGLKANLKLDDLLEALKIIEPFNRYKDAREDIIKEYTDVK